MTTLRIPERLDCGKNVCGTMYSLWSDYVSHKQIMKAKEGSLVTDVAESYACGYPVPYFQRDLCWSRSQEVRFIESAWLGLNIGSYTLHKMDWESVGSDAKALKFSGWLIDGQQRLTTIERYWNDEFKVFGLLFSELNSQERRRFMSITFYHFEVELWDEKTIRDLYNRMAFGGTAHKESEKA